MRRSGCRGPAITAPMSAISICTRRSAFRMAAAAPAWDRSASRLTNSYIYILMMGGEGLTRATEIAILNANYIATKLHPHFPVLYRNAKGRVAHECIID